MKTEFWSDKRAPGVPNSVDTGKYASLLEVAENAFEKFTDKPAFTCLGKTLSYGDVEALSRSFAAWLQNHTELKAGDAIAIQLPNLLQYPVVAYAAIRAGLIIVNTNPLYTLTELSHQLKDSGAKAVVCLSSNLDNIYKATVGSQVGQVIATGALDLVAPQGESVDAAGAVPTTSLTEALEKGAAATYARPAARTQSDLAMLQYTGGTTGVAKGAMLTQGNIIANIIQYNDGIYNEQKADGTLLVPGGEQIVVAPLPIYHIYSFTMNLMVYPSRGDHSILIPNPRDMDQFIAAIQPYQFTMLVGLNTLFIGLMSHPKFAECDFSKLALTLSGGTALKSEVGRKWEEFTGSKVIEGYGLTETSPVVSAGPLGDMSVAGTVGQPAPNTQIKTVDADGNETPVGERGELCVRGPQVMAGYWQRPDATDEVIDADGWFHTGDVAIIDDNGCIRIVDRLKDMVLVSGFNVYPNEIEDVVAKCDGVVSCAVIGVPDEASGEAVRLYVIPRDEQLTEAVLKDWCRQHLTGYKIPKQIIFRETLPMTAVGKVLRKDLRAEALKEFETETAPA